MGARQRDAAGRDSRRSRVTRPIEAGPVDYLASSRRYWLNGGLSDDMKQALREL